MSLVVKLCTTVQYDLLLFILFLPVKMLYRLGIEFSSDTIMEYPRIIAPGAVHRSRTENQQPDVNKGLDKASFDLKNSIVRLQCDFGGVSLAFRWHLSTCD